MILIRDITLVCLLFYVVISIDIDGVLELICVYVFVCANPIAGIRVFSQESTNRFVKMSRKFSTAFGKPKEV